MNAKPLTPYLLAPIVALSTFACSSDPSAPSGEGDPSLAEIEEYLGSSLPLRRTSPVTNVTAGPNTALAGNSGGLSTPPQSDYEGPPPSVSPSYAESHATASVTGASTTVTSSSLVIGESGSCGAYAASGSSAMLAMASAGRLTTQDPWGPFCYYTGNATTGGQTFQVLDLGCGTLSGQAAVASGTVSISALPVSDSDTFTGSASVGGSSISVNCPAGPTSCTTTMVQQTVAACPPPGGSGSSSSTGGGVGGMCTFTQTTITPGGTGGAVIFSFLTSVGASIVLNTSVKGNGSAWDGIRGTAGVNSTTSASLDVRLLL